MFPNMRTPAVVVVLLMGLGGCGDTAAPHGANLLSLSSAQSGACGRNDNQLRCWGYVSTLSGSSSSVPVQPAAPIGSLELVRSSPFDEGGCGLDSGGALFCWGYNGSGYKAVAPDLRFSDVTLGGNFQCALATSNVVYCWGYGSYTGISEQDTAMTKCGTSPTTYPCVAQPAPITSDQRFKAVAAGVGHTCAIAQSGQVFCWGAMTGAGPNLQSSQIPVPVASQERFSVLSSASDGSCAINTAGQPFCWGYNTGGMLGSSEAFLDAPTPVALATGVVMKTIALGYSHTCTIDATGAAWCWGTGGLGSGSASSQSPVQVLGALTFSSLAAGSGFTCGIASNGAWCWGANGGGQLGNGGTADSSIPVRVAGQDQFDD